MRLECDHPDCENLVEVPIEPDETPREVAAAAGWSLVRLGDDEILRCPEHPLRAGLIRPTLPPAQRPQQTGWGFLQRRADPQVRASLAQMSATRPPRLESAA